MVSVMRAFLPKMVLLEHLLVNSGWLAVLHSTCTTPHLYDSVIFHHAKGSRVAAHLRPVDFLLDSHLICTAHALLARLARFQHVRWYLLRNVLLLIADLRTATVSEFVGVVLGHILPCCILCSSPFLCRASGVIGA